MPRYALRTTLLILATLALAACEPEVGSEEWCEKMNETPRGEWTMDETGDYAKHCMFK